MASMNFAPPPSLHGTAEEQLAQLHRFLFMLTEQMNAAHTQTDNQIAQATETVSAAAQQASASIAANENTNYLRKLIQNAEANLQGQIDQTVKTVNHVGPDEDGNVDVNASGSADNYGQVETPTGGIWIDAKPVYRRVFTADVVDGVPVQIAHDGDLDTVIRLDGSIFTGEIHYPLTCRQNDESLDTSIFVDSSSIVVNPGVSGSAIVIMEYTKSTDESNAGYLRLITADGYAFMTADGQYFLLKEST